MNQASHSGHHGRLRLYGLPVISTTVFFMIRPIKIAPRRSAALFATLALAMVALSYVTVLALAAACVYFPYLLVTSAERLQFQVLALFVGGVVLAGAMLWSLVPRAEKFEAPGLLLTPAEQPALFEMLKEVAESLNEPMPREVYLIGEVNAFVRDRGGFLGFGSWRVMGIGLPLFSMFTVSEFRAVLAHEFAHYYSGDTRMGPWVARAQSAMARTFQNIGRVGQLGRVAIIQILYLVVVFILKNLFIFFLKVVHFVSRKKEFRADELACLIAGAGPLVTGLRKIHGGGLAWHAYWATEVAPLVGDGYVPPIGNGFVKFLAAPKIAEKVEQHLQEELDQSKTDPYDTHPPLKQRLSAIQALKLDSAISDDRPATTLLNQPELAELEFLKLMNPKLAEKSLQAVPWEGIETSVTIPGWAAAVGESAAIFNGLTVESLPEAIGNSARFAARIPAPDGVLLSVEQRSARARQLLLMALGLVLLENEWTLEAQPGIFLFHRGSENIHLPSLLEELASGKLSADAWKLKCAEWGIAGAALLPERIPAQATNG